MGIIRDVSEGIEPIPDPGYFERKVNSGWGRIAAKLAEDLKATEARELELLQLTVTTLEKIAAEPDPVAAQARVKQALEHFEATLKQYEDGSV